MTVPDDAIPARLEGERFLVTPSGISKGLVRADQLVTVDGQGELVGASRYGPQRGLRASSEILLHLEAYIQRPDAQSVIHAHPPIAVALSIAVLIVIILALAVVVTLAGRAGAPPPPILWKQVMRGAVRRVPLRPFCTPFRRSDTCFPVSVAHEGAERLSPAP